MSVKAMTWAWDQPVKPGPKLVLVALADHSDGAGVCWPGHDLIANKCGLSRQTVLEHIATLEKDGYLIAEAGRDSRGRVVRSRYFLQLARPEAPPCRDSRHGAMSDNPTRSHVGISGSTMSGFPVPIKEEPKAIEPKTQANPRLFELGKTAIEAWFNAKFWARYPKKVGRAKALQVLIEASPDPALLNEIEEGLSHRLAAEAAAHAKGEWFRAWPDPHRWLRPADARWRDRFDVPRETKRDERGCWQCSAPAVAVVNGKAHCRKHDPIFFSEGIAR
jgi:hypothetical protein